MLDRFDSMPRTVRLLTIAVLIALLGAIDLGTGFELSFAFFYLLPVGLAAWSLGQTLGLTASLLSAVVWVAANRLAGETLADAVIVWNGATRLGFFVVVAVLLARMREVLERERVLSRTDDLTNTLNSRAFREAAAAELDRGRRYARPFTLVYLGLDNFKAVNDRFGHSVGDELLEAVARTIRATSRRTDTIARLGGDEFAILMPETDADAARRAVENLRVVVLEAMRVRGWPVTVSVGALTCLNAPEGVDALVSRADNLMYEVKRASKDAVAYAVYSERDRSPVQEAS